MGTPQPRTRHTAPRNRQSRRATAGQPRTRLHSSNSPRRPPSPRCELTRIGERAASHRSAALRSAKLTWRVSPRSTQDEFATCDPSERLTFAIADRLVGSGPVTVAAYRGPALPRRCRPEEATNRAGHAPIIGRHGHRFRITDVPYRGTHIRCAEHPLKVRQLGDVRREGHLHRNASFLSRALRLFRRGAKRRALASSPVNEPAKGASHLLIQRSIRPRRVRAVPSRVVRLSRTGSAARW
jgi:hypothetical protein